jgi:hypothetical protein
MADPHTLTNWAQPIESKTTTRHDTTRHDTQFVAQFGGISRWVFNTFVENNMAVTNNGMGTFYFLGGGVMVRA